MPPKRKVTLQQLVKALTSKTDSVRYNAMFDFAHSDISPEATSTLLKALKDECPGVVRYAAVSLARLGPATKEFGTPQLDIPQVVWDLIAAARGIDPVTGMPQSYPDCLDALVKIMPECDLVLGLVHDQIGLTNWYPLKASLQALKTIGTKESIDLLKRSAAFWMPELDKKQKRIVQEIVAQKR